MIKIQTFLQILTMKKPIKVLTVGYIVALTLIAGMSLGAHFVVEHVITEQESVARVIGYAGRQDTLSQRSTLYLSKLAANPHDDITRQNLSAMIDILEQSHEGLTMGSKTMRIPSALPSNAYRVYFEEPEKLNDKMRDYISNVREILALPAEELHEGHELYIRAYSFAVVPLHESLKLAVKAYERDADRRMNNLVGVQQIAIISILMVILIEAFLIFRPLVDKVRAYSETLEKLASTDPMTGIANRWAFYQAVHKEFKRAKRHDRATTLMVLDLDHFKSVNDTYGHQAGDEVLKSSAKMIGDSLRSEDTFGRVGGEEFAVLLPETSIDQAKIVADKILHMLRDNAIALKAGSDKETLHVTSSIGMAQFNAEEDVNVEDLFQRADKALYKAKDAGRDRYVIE